MRYQVRLSSSACMASSSVANYENIETLGCLFDLEKHEMNTSTYDTNLDLTQQAGNGIYLTWEDLWVNINSTSIYRSDKGSKSVLRGLTGYACPGEVLAIMGPSGCGKSTLLDALAGRLSSRTSQKGEILINGRKQKLAYGTSAYVTQEDTLTSTLSVREAVNYSAQLQLPSKMSKSQKKEIAERTIREMGLQDCIDTRIGGYSKKGLSNGQKRRVSICLELLKRPKCLFLDEPTSGLDSAASYFVMKRIVDLAREYKMTVVSSIHQPTSEVFKLLHNLCLLSSGRTVYFGPSCLANEFFAANGFACPTLENPADHYLKLINTDFDEDIECGAGNYITAEEVINLLSSSYTSSDAGAQTEKLISEIRKRKWIPTDHEKEDQANFLTQCIVLTHRSFINMHRDLGYYWLRLIIFIAMAFGLGSVFYNLGTRNSSINERASLLMFVASLLTIMAIGSFPSFVEDLKVFRRDRLNGHYNASAYVIANTVSSAPFVVLISAVPSGITYFLSGLNRGTSQFSYFTITLFACMALVESLMMTVATLMPDFLMRLIVGAGVQGMMMLSGGFFQLPKDLPRIFWKFPMYYVAFHRYAYQGLYKNEFEGLRFSGGVEGESVLRDVLQVEIGWSKWVDLAVLMGMVIVYRVVFFVVVKVGEGRR